jgi:LPS-assembly lipoprotein
MSLPDQTRKSRFQRSRNLALAGVLLAAAAASACTVRPLYSTAPVAPGVPAVATTGLRSIEIKPVKTRYAQQVRNHLIFGLNGGAGQPATPLYSLDLDITERETASAIVQRVTEDEPTAATITITSHYTLKEIGTDKVVSFGKREISSAFDIPRQEFAALRARINAEDRAARELAELLRLALAQDLARPH